jgi:hypothetical protein
VSPVAERFLRLTASRRALLSCGQKTNKQTKSNRLATIRGKSGERVCVWVGVWLFNVCLVCVERGERCEGLRAERRPLSGVERRL